MRLSSNTERLYPEGTRVVLLRLNAAAVPGIISKVRREPHLKTYVVTCDDGTTVFASPNNLAREDDASRAPLGPALEY